MQCTLDDLQLQFGRSTVHAQQLPPRRLSSSEDLLGFLHDLCTASARWDERWREALSVLSMRTLRRRTLVLHCPDIYCMSNGLPSLLARLDAGSTYQTCTSAYLVICVLTQVESIIALRLARASLQTSTRAAPWLAGTRV